MDWIHLATSTDNIMATLGFIGVGLAIGVFSVRHASRSPHSLIDLSLVRIPTFGVNFWGGTLFRAGIGALPFLLPLLFQVVFGMSAFSSGLLTFASAIGSVAMKASTPPILKRFGFRNVLIWNGVLTALSVLSCIMFRPTTPAMVIFLVLLVSGFFQSLQFSSLNSLPYADIPPHKMSSATSLAQLMQQVGKAVGIAAAAVILQLTLAWRGGDRLSTTEFLYAFIGCAILALASLPFYIALSSDSGAELSGYWRKPSVVPPPSHLSVRPYRRCPRSREKHLSFDAVPAVHAQPLLRQEPCLIGHFLRSLNPIAEIEMR